MRLSRTTPAIPSACHLSDAQASAARIGLRDKVAFLSDPDNYGEHPSRVDAVETHMSWVFLTDEFAYKLKKPVRTDFLDFSSLAARHHHCEEKARLNRRLAPNIYLGLALLTANDSGQLALKGHGETVEWLVKMRRPPRELMLDFRLYKGGWVPPRDEASCRFSWRSIGARVRKD